MSKNGRSEQSEVIDLTEPAHQDIGTPASNSGLTRRADTNAPPWRPEKRSTILERPKLALDDDLAIEPAEFRRSLFESDDRIISLQAPNPIAEAGDRSLGRPHGPRWRRFLKRR